MFGRSPLLQKNKQFLLALATLLSFCIMIKCAPVVQAAETETTETTETDSIQLEYGTMQYYQGVTSMEVNHPIMFLDCVMVNTTDPEGEYYWSYSYSATYEGTTDGYIMLNGLTPGTFLNGPVTFIANVELDNSTGSSTHFNYLDANLDPVQSDYYTLDMLVYSRASSTLTYHIALNFNGYAVNDTVLKIPFQLDYSAGVLCTGDYNVNVANLYATTSVTDIENAVDVYSDLRDINTIDGYFARQNYGIFTGLLDTLSSGFQNLSDWCTNIYWNMLAGFNSVIDSLNSNTQQIVDQDNTQHQEEMLQSSEQHDELVNGYQGSIAEDANDNFNAGADELTGVEGELSDTSSQYINDYTATGFDTGVLATISSSMLFVATWFTNFWNMGGIWTSCLNLCFAISIAFFILKIRG